MDKKNIEEKKYLIRTYGCQMNEHDSEKISWILNNMNYKPTEDLEEADFIIYNTCLIRENAELKVYGNLGSLKTLKKKKPDLMIAVCGCMMQNEDIRNEITSKYRHVDLIFGTNNIHKLPQLIANHQKTGKTVVDILEDNREIDESIDADRLYSYKAYVNITYGCDNFCTYCVVPYTRGRENSREPEKIIDEIIDMTISLSKNPEIYPPYKYKTNNSSIYRAFEIYHYRISYRIANESIYIVRMRHTSMSPLIY